MTVARQRQSTTAIRPRSPALCVNANRTKHLLLAVVIARNWLYWDSLFSVPIGPYLFHIFDICAAFLVLFLFLTGAVQRSQFVTCGGALVFICAINMVTATIATSQVRLLDYLAGSFYFILPISIVACLDADQSRCVRVLLFFTLLSFAVQQILGAFGIIQSLAGRMGTAGTVVYAQYAGLYRPNNTLGGGTAGAQQALLFLVTYLALSSPWSVREAILLTLVSLGVVLSFSRTAWAGLAMLWVVILAQPRRWERRRRPLVFVAVFATALFLGTSLGLLVAPRASALDTVLSDQSRASRLRDAVDEWKESESPLFGSGIGSGWLRSWTAVNTRPGLPDLAPRLSALEYRLGGPHNSYVVLLYEFGILGTVLVLMVLFGLARISRRDVRLLWWWAVAFSFGLLWNVETSPLMGRVGTGIWLLVWSLCVRSCETGQVRPRSAKRYSWAEGHGGDRCA